MTDDFQLPADLAAIEAELAAAVLAAPRIHRDQLMYRAGWAARAAQSTNVAPAPTTARLSRWRVAQHLLTTATVASLAVVVTLFAGGRRESQQANGNGAAPALANSHDASPAAKPQEAPREAATIAGSAGASRSLIHEVDAILNASDRGGRPLVASPWILRSVADARSFPRLDEGGVTHDRQPRTTTARDLLEEFLPPSTNDSASAS